MHLPGTVYGIISILAVGFLEHAALATELPSPPVAERRPVTTQHHGIRLTDDYAWLRTAEPSEVVEDPAALEARIRAYLNAESDYARAMLAPNRALERQLVAEMRGRLSRRDQSVPEPWGAWEYFTRYPPGAQRTVHCRRPRGGGVRRFCSMRTSSPGAPGLFHLRCRCQSRSQAPCLLGRRGRV